MMLLKLAILCLTERIVFGRPNGAPAGSCLQMTPIHEAGRGSHPPLYKRQEGGAPYRVIAEVDGENVRLLINGSIPIAGFLVQARERKDGPAVGKFNLPSQTNDSIAKYQSCTSIKNNEFSRFSSITHTNAEGKNNITFQWSPSDRNQNITVRFYATLAFNKGMFWVRLPSNEINTMDLKSGTPGRRLPHWTLSLMVFAFMIMMNLL